MMMDLRMIFKAPINPVFLCLRRNKNTWLDTLSQTCLFQVFLASDIWPQNRKRSYPYLSEWDTMWTCFLAAVWKASAAHQ
jgi:hypothetical protein